MEEYQNIFAKDYVQNWSEVAFMVKKVINTVRWT